jgi:hypothetical protein
VNTVLVGGVVVAGLIVLAGIAMAVTRRVKKARSRTTETAGALESTVERLERIADRLEKMLVQLREGEPAHQGLADAKFGRGDLLRGTADSAQERGVRTRGSVPGPDLQSAHVEQGDDVVQSLMSQLDRQPMTLLQVRDCVAQFGRQVATLAQIDSGDWLLLALSDGSANRWFVLPRLHIAMGEVRLMDYFELRNYNGVDPLRARDITRVPCIEKTRNGWSVFAKGLIDVQAM